MNGDQALEVIARIRGSVTVNMPAGGCACIRKEGNEWRGIYCKTWSPPFPTLYEAIKHLEGEGR